MLEITEIGGLLMLSLFFIFGYFELRNILWSIVWCDKGGKYNRLKETKTGRSFFELLTMRYLIQYIKEHQKEYRFWLKIKGVYVFLQPLLLAVYIVFCFFDGTFFEISKGVIIAEVFVVIAFLLLQFDTARNTVYDRIRIDKRRKN